MTKFTITFERQLVQMYVFKFSSITQSLDILNQTRINVSIFDLVCIIRRRCFVAVCLKTSYINKRLFCNRYDRCR